MKTYPLKCISVDEAIKFQFKLVDCMTREFSGSELLTRGDLGVVPGLNKPVTTEKAEQVIAEFFGAEACILVRGSGSGAIRFGLHSMMGPGEKILIHKAPAYTTTGVSFKMLNLIPVEADYNDLEEIRKVAKANPDIRGALVQHTRQKPEDSYDMRRVVEQIKACADIPILADDSYAAMKAEHIGIQCGADLSCFSSFKLLGPEGIGVIAGRSRYIEKLVEENYSGGMQVQGHEAMDVLYGLVYAPVALAIQAQVCEECAARLKAGEIPGVKDAFVANAQSRVVLVELEEKIAEAVLKEAEKLGAAPNPVGAESKYEMAPMFYRLSGTFRQEDPSLSCRMIRINPMRSGADTVIRILKSAMERGRACS